MLELLEKPSEDSSLSDGSAPGASRSYSLRPDLLPPTEPGCLGLLFRRASDGLTLPFRCDSWDCPECGPSKASRVARAIRLACIEHGLEYLITLTLPGKGHPLRGEPVASREAVGPMWNALRTYLRKHGELGLEYLVLPEWQKDGTCHLHLATDQRVSWRVLSEAWARLGGGFAWCSPKREMRNAEDVGREIAKYLTKAQGNPKATPTTLRCKEGGGFRRRPWHRYWPSRSVGRTINKYLRDLRQEDAVDPPPGDRWSVVVPVDWGDTIDYPPFKGHRVPIIEDCPGHLETATACCHGDPPWTRCVCGGPALSWERDQWRNDEENGRLRGKPPPVPNPGGDARRPNARDSLLDARSTTTVQPPVSVYLTTSRTPRIGGSWSSPPDDPGPGLGPGPSPSLSEALESPDVEAPEAEDVGNDVSRSRGPST